MQAQRDEVVEEYYWAKDGHAAADHVALCWSLVFKWTALLTVHLLRCFVQMTNRKNRGIYKNKRGKKEGKREQRKLTS